MAHELRSTRLALTTVIAAMVLCRTAVADEPPAPRVEDPPPARVEWKWKNFQAWEYPVTAVALPGAFAMRFAAPSPGPNWTGGILMDGWVQDHTAIQDVSTRHQVAKLTDYMFYGSMAYRFIDSSILPLAVWGKPNVAWQMSWIDLESFAFQGLLLWSEQLLFGRERPFVKRCGDPAFAASESGCDPNSAEHNRSFYAGHPATVLTAAGLTCTHHGHMPLYGGGTPDQVACGMMIAAAALTGIGREITEKHHTSDVLFGWGVGIFAGWVLPEVLHYGRGKPDVEATAPSPTAIRLSVYPMIGLHDVGVGLGAVL